MTLEEYMRFHGFRDSSNDRDDNDGSSMFRRRRAQTPTWVNTYSSDSDNPTDKYKGPSADELVARYNANAANPNPYLGTSFEKYGDSGLLNALYGTAGYIAPATASAWGMGGGHGELQSLEDFYRSIAPQLTNADDIDTGNDNRMAARRSARNANDAYAATFASERVTPEMLAKRAAFEAKYPGHYQLSPDQVYYRDGKVQIKQAGPSVGQYVERPGEVKYDPEYGYITTVGNDARAGDKGGGYQPLFGIAAAALAPWAMEAFGGLGAGAGGLEAGGLNAISAADAALIDGANAGLWGGADAAWGINAAGIGDTVGGLSASDAAWGVNAATGAGGLSQAELAALIESGTAGYAGAGLEAAGALGQGLSASQYAALQAGGALSAPGAFNVADFIKNGTLPSGPGAQPPAIPGAGNGVGLIEVAQAGLQGGAGTALSRVINGTATAADWAQIAGGVGSAGLGMLGANAQGDAYSDVADKYLGLGAPYRDKLAASYAPGFSMADQPDFMNAMDIGAQAAARATSAKVGNPVDNPGAYSEMQKFITGSLALPQLNTYRSQLGSFGQLGTNTAGTASMGEASQTGGMYDALGSGLASLTKPKNPYEDLMKGLMGGFKLNTGTSW